MVGAGGGCWQREHAFLFQVLLKPTLTHREGKPRRFPSNNEQVGRGMGSSQPGEGGLGQPQATYMSPKLFQLPAFLRTMWERHKDSQEAEDRSKGKTVGHSVYWDF
jgi:hypothetical protein